MENKETFNVEIMVSQYARKLSKDTVTFHPDVWDEEHLDYNIYRVHKVNETLQYLLNVRKKVRLNEAYDLLGLPPEPKYDEFIDQRTGEKKFIGWDHLICDTVELAVIPDNKNNFIIVDFNVSPSTCF